MSKLQNLLFLSIVAMMLMMAPSDAYAQKKPATQKKSVTNTAKKSPAKSAPQKKSTAKKIMSRSEYEKQQKDLQKRISETEKMILVNDKSVKAQSRDIKLREQEIGHRLALLEAMNLEIEAIAFEEDSLQRVIQDLQDSFEAKKKKYGMAMRHLYKSRSGYDELLFILSSNTMIESVRRMRYLKQYSEWRKKEALELEEQRIATAEAKEKLSKTMEERQSVLSNLNKEKEALTKKQLLQEAALSDLKKRGKELQAELERDQKQQAEIEKKIQQMIDAERRKAAEAEKKQQQQGKKPAQNKSASASASAASASASVKDNPAPAANSALTGSFRSNKGKLPYPVDSSYAFLRHYKEKNDGNVSITLSTPTGANACAIFEGVVLRCSRSSDDYTIIIKHGDYMSVYSNLSSVNVKEGQKVKIRQSLGKIKTDINGKRGELMFWIYGKTDAENPEAWLKR